MKMMFSLCLIGILGNVGLAAWRGDVPALFGWVVALMLCSFIVFGVEERS